MQKNLLFVLLYFMSLLYNILVLIVGFLLKIIAFFNKKIALFVNGRKESFSKLEVFQKTDDVIWIHAASLGEFEQARPIIEELKQQYTSYKILVTFFSPSGYEIRKNYELADVVCYLPLDTISNAKKFVDKVNPKLAVFVKYEFWPNYLKQLKKREIPTILVSGILRDNQIFFKWYGLFMRNALKTFQHFFVQNTDSKALLKSIQFFNVTIAGDTRFDRVSRILEQDNKLDFINKFKNKSYTVVAGSTWAEDEQLFVNYINTDAQENEKFIIAPHNIKADSIKALQKAINKKTVLYSELQNEKHLQNAQVFIVDTIGLLTKIYAAADVAYVGGGLRTGLHNILEPATFGVPVIIGNKYDKFKEAKDLVALEGCVSIKNQKEFTAIFNQLKTDEKLRKRKGEINYNYVQEHKGATQKIMDFIYEIL